MKTIRPAMIILAFWALMFWNCASEKAPGGGPPDKTPPVLMFSNIVSGSTLVPADLDISFVFSEMLDPNLIAKSVTVFPLGDNVATVRSRGKNLIVHPVNGWNPDIVYTLILGKNISDMRGNALREPYQFSFTSGAVMPDNMIAGQIRELQSGTTAVICIRREAGSPEEIIRNPEYYVQSGSDGQFMFEHLPADLFHIAAYVDIDKSNDYKPANDGACIPSTPAVVPDTSGTPVLFEAVYENFLPGFAINAESLQPDMTQLTFSKPLAEWNAPDCFSVNGVTPDTILYKNTTCTLYHADVPGDTFAVQIRGLVDVVDVPLPDSTFLIPATARADSFFHFEQLSGLLYISPDPFVDGLTGTFQTIADTSDITLTRTLPGFYLLPTVKTRQQGTCLLRLPFPDMRTDSDSLYAVQLSLDPVKEYGSVLGSLDIKSTGNIVIVLFNDRDHVETTPAGQDFHLPSVVPGSYTLAYYVDRNANGRRDRGRPDPFIQPEFLNILDKDIQVRARWDTALETPYKIDIEND